MGLASVDPDGRLSSTRTLVAVSTTAIGPAIGGGDTPPADSVNTACVPDGDQRTVVVVISLNTLKSDPSRLNMAMAPNFRPAMIVPCGTTVIVSVSTDWPVATCEDATTRARPYAVGVAVWPDKAIGPDSTVSEMLSCGRGLPQESSSTAGTWKFAPR